MGGTGDAAESVARDTMLAKGIDGQVEIAGQKIRIMRQEFGAAADPQEMMFSEISSVLFEPAGTIVAGHIQFMFTGGQGAKTVIFTKEQQPAFETLKAKLDELQNPLDQTPAAASARGHEELVEIVGTKIRITRKGGGSQEIMPSQILSILFKPAGTIVGGAIQFAFTGGQKAKTVTFTKKQQPDFEALKAKLNELQNFLDQVSDVQETGNVAESESRATLLTKGIDGQVEIVGPRIRITREGFAASALGNRLGSTEIMLSRISSIQFRKCGPRFKTLGSISDTVGYIHFTLRGQEAKEDILQAKAEGVYRAQKDEYAVTFTEEQQPAFEVLTVKLDELRNSLDQAPAEAAVAKGFGRQVEIVGTRIRITRQKGIFLSGGLPDTKEIMISQISSIQFETAGTTTNGYIQFTLTGDQEAKKDIESDENAVIFTKEQQPAFEALKAKIDKIRNSLDQGPIAVAPVSPLDELEKLASLRTRGVISEDEFQAKKKQLLNL